MRAALDGVPDQNKKQPPKHKKTRIITKTKQQTKHNKNKKNNENKNTKKKPTNHKTGQTPAHTNTTPETPEPKQLF